jgi:hypothetical protein
LVFRHRPRPALSDQQVSVTAIQREPISHMMSNQIDPVDGICKLAGEYHRFDLIDTKVSTPLLPGIWLRHSALGLMHGTIPLTWLKVSAEQCPYRIGAVQLVG